MSAEFVRSGLASAFFRTTKASPEAHAWVKSWAVDHGGTVLSSLDEIDEVSAKFLGLVMTAHRRGYLTVPENPTVQYSLPPLPAGAELILLKGAVRWGFVLKHNDAIWMGYSEAGNSTPTYVWPATPEEFAALTAFTQGTR